MLDVTDCTVLLARESGAPRRAMTILVTVQNHSNQFFTRCRLLVTLQTRRGFPAGSLTLEGGAITPGEQVLSFQSHIDSMPVGQIYCELSYILGRWVTTVRGIAPHQAPQRTAPPEPEASPEHPEGGDDEPLTGRVLLPPVEGAEPFLGPDMNTMPLANEDNDEENASGADGPDPSDPWTVLEAGDEDGAKALFLQQKLNSDGRQRVRELLASSEPAVLAQACRISRWGQWSVPLVMRRLLKHADPVVRLEAVTSLGVMAGLSLLRDVQPLLRDSDPAVQAAAAVAVRQMRGQEPRDHTV